MRESYREGQSPLARPDVRFWLKLTPRSANPLSFAEFDRIKLEANGHGMLTDASPGQYQLSLIRGEKIDCAGDLRTAAEHRRPEPFLPNPAVSRLRVHYRSGAVAWRRHALREVSHLVASQRRRRRRQRCGGSDIGRGSDSRGEDRKWPDPSYALRTRWEVLRALSRSWRLHHLRALGRTGLVSRR